MKKLFLHSAILFVFAILSNCKCTNIKENQNFNARMAPEIDTTRIIVRYPHEWTDADKEVFLDTMPIKNKDRFIDKCECGDPNLIQLTWDYDNFRPGEIQKAKKGLEGGPGKAQGDWPFTFHLPTLTEKDSFDVTNTKLLNEQQLAELDGLKQSLHAIDGNSIKVNLAIIDTGIDYYKNRDQQPFLYKSENTGIGCLNQASGWNFIYNTKDVSDDNGHGTYVTRLITSVLQKQGVEYRILPIKAFDKHGKGKYWNLVCSLSYVRELQRQNQQNQNKDLIHIVNTSWGYSFFETLISDDVVEDYKHNSIAKEIIDSMKKSITFVASAGNINNDVDIFRQENFPASFTSTNIIGVGGYVTTAEGKQTDGNYGAISIDVAAPYTDYKFDFIKESVTLTGSSYSAAYTSAKIAALIKSLQPVGTSGVIIPPNTVKATFYDPANDWIKLDKGLANEISEGRYQE